MHIFKYGQKEISYLKQRDKILGVAIDDIGFIRRKVTPEPFTALIESIVSQQISSKAAATVWGRMEKHFSTMSPNIIADAPIEELQSQGISYRKAAYIQGIAQAVLDKRIVFSQLVHMEDEEIIKHLSALPGIGIWTAEMFLIFSMQRPDVVSWGDLAIRRGMMKLYGISPLTKEKFQEYRKKYSPYGSVASLYLWAISKK